MNVLDLMIVILQSSIRHRRMSNVLFENDFIVDEHKQSIGRRLLSSVQIRAITYIRFGSCEYVSWWRHQIETFHALLALCAGNSPVQVNSPHKGQWRGALMFSLICVWINGWVNNHEGGDLRRHRGHYDVSVMVSAGKLTKHYLLYLVFSSIEVVRNSWCLGCPQNASELICKWATAFHGNMHVRQTT